MIIIWHSYLQQNMFKTGMLGLFTFYIYSIHVFYKDLFVLIKFMNGLLIMVIVFICTHNVQTDDRKVVLERYVL